MGPAGKAPGTPRKAQGIVAFGTSKELIADIAKRGGKTLDSVLTGTVRQDLPRRRSRRLRQRRLPHQAIRRPDRSGPPDVDGRAGPGRQQGATPAPMQFAKDFYGGLFDSLKYADGLTLNIDFAGEGAPSRRRS